MSASVNLFGNQRSEFGNWNALQHSTSVYLPDIIMHIIWHPSCVYSKHEDNHNEWWSGRVRLYRTANPLCLQIRHLIFQHHRSGLRGAYQRTSFHRPSRTIYLPLVVPSLPRICDISHMPRLILYTPLMASVVVP